MAISIHHQRHLCSSPFVLLPKLNGLLTCDPSGGPTLIRQPKGFRHPSEVNLNALNVEVMTEDGVKLRGWLITKKENKQILIYFHENAGSKNKFSRIWEFG